MPQYHFNVVDGVNFPDLRGIEMADLAAARGEAIRFAAQLLKEHAHSFWINSDWRMEVTDAVGLILFTLHFSAIDSPAVQSLTKVGVVPEGNAHKV